MGEVVVHAREARAVAAVLEQVLPDVDEGRRAAKSDDWVKVGRVAHAANGAAGTLCLDELRENCVRLEIVARAKDTQQLPDAMAAWTDSMYQVLDWLSAAANADQLTPISTLP